MNENTMKNNLVAHIAHNEKVDTVGYTWFKISKLLVLNGEKKF